MNPKICSKFTYEDWLLRASGDVSAWRRRAMEKHQAVCPECAAIRAETDALFARTQTALRVAPPPTIPARIWRETAAKNNHSSHRSPLLRGLAVGTLCAAVIAGGVAVFAPGFPGRPTVAFAQVEQAMGEIRTATWTDVTYTDRYKGDGTDAATWKWYQQRPSKYENWVQLDPPRLSVRQVRRPGETEDTEYDHIVSDGRYSLSAFPYRRGGGQDYFRGDYSPNPVWTDAGPEENIRREVIFPRDLPATTSETHPETRTSDTSERMIERSAWKQERDRLDGTEVLRFTSRFKRGGPEWRRQTDTTLWVDPSNYRIVRREIRSVPLTGRGASWRRISENFRYNETPPPGVLEIAPPPVGQPYKYTDLSKEGWILKRPPAAEQQAIRKLVQQAIEAWNRRDGKAFTDLWDFAYGDLQAQAYQPEQPNKDTKAERRRHWQNRVTQGSPYKTWKIQKIWTAESWGGIWIRRTESDPFPPDTRPKEYSVTVTGWATFEPGSKATLCDGSFRIVRDGDQFRITYINMYKKLAVSAFFKKPPWDTK